MQLYCKLNLQFLLKVFILLNFFIDPVEDVND